MTIKQTALRIWDALLQRTPPQTVIRYIGPRGPAGIHVDHDIAMTYSAVWACVKVIAETIGVLGWHVFERTGTGKTKRTDLWLDTMLDSYPNPEMTAQTFRETLTAHCALWGNGYAEIVRDGAGRPNQLWPLLPDRVFPRRDQSGQLYYEYRVGGLSGNSNGQTIVPLEAANVLHVKGLGYDGVVGYDVIAYQAMAIGMGIANERYASAFFKNGAHLSFGLVAEKQLDKEARASLRTAFEEAYSGGPGQAFKVAVFDNGVKPQQFSVSPEASQLVENRKFAVTDIARIFRVPPHMIADLEKSAFANIEQQSIDFVMHTILPWATRWEQEANAKLLGPRFTKGYTKLNLGTLMRGDQKTRYEAYKIGREWGWLNANEIREWEHMDPIPGDAGTAYIVPLNYQLADEIGQQPEPAPGAPPKPNGDAPGNADQGEPAPKQGAKAQRAPGEALGPVLAQAAERIQSREWHALSKRAEKLRGDPRRFRDELEPWLTIHSDYIEDQLRPVFLALGLDEAQALAAADAVATAEELAIRETWAPERSEDPTLDSPSRHAALLDTIKLNAAMRIQS